MRYRIWNWLDHNIAHGRLPVSDRLSCWICDRWEATVLRDTGYTPAEIKDILGR